jgi:undecaprenyl pyrophosphate phosphatase UppP
MLRKWAITQEHQNICAIIWGFIFWYGFVGYLIKQVKTLNMNNLITVVIALIVVGIILWLINRYIPMANSIKQILNAVVIIGVILWLLRVFGIWGGNTA